MKQEETTKEKASKKNKKHDFKPFVYPYDLGWRRNLSQVSKGQLEALHITNGVEIGVSGWVVNFCLECISLQRLFRSWAVAETPRELGVSRYKDYYYM